MENKQRNRYIIIRVTDDEYNDIKDNSSSFNSMSHYIRTALKNYSNINMKNILESIEKLTEYYEKHYSLLYHTSANLNQVVKRANELNSAGLLSHSYLKSLKPYIDDTVTRINETKTFMHLILKNLIP